MFVVRAIPRVHDRLFWPGAIHNRRPTEASAERHSRERLP